MSRLFVGLLLLLLSATPAFAQTTAAFMVDSARAKLARTWDDTKNPQQPERGFCMAFNEDRIQDSTVVYVVTDVTPAETAEADPYTTIFRCPEGMAHGHVHTPTTCMGRKGKDVDLSSCVFGGPDAYICFPSPMDIKTLNRDDGEPFAALQCDRQAVVFYFPQPQKLSTETRDGPTTGS